MKYLPAVGIVEALLRNANEIWLLLEEKVFVTGTFSLGYILVCIA